MDHDIWKCNKDKERKIKRIGETKKTQGYKL